MRCPKCDKRIESGTKFCMHCGKKIKKINPLWIIIPIIVFIVGGFGSLIAFSNYSEHKRILAEQQQLEETKKKLKRNNSNMNLSFIVI